MLGKMWRKDIARNKLITAILFMFIMISSLLVASSASMLLELFRSVDDWFEKAGVPHFVQMHAGEIDQREMDGFSSRSELVKEQQTVEMISIEPDHVYFGPSGESEDGSVMEMSFVKQNKAFDFLLDLNNKRLDVLPGEIAVPIYFMQQHSLELGDTVRLAKGSFSKTFTIADFVRDAQMNPSIVSSKRIVVSDSDWETLKGHFDEKEYLIEFLLHDGERTSEFEQLYLASGLPHQGTAITYAQFRLLNALTDGVAAVVILLASVLMIVIAFLCLRFTMLAALEEDVYEIGVMKAIGIASDEIRQLYLMKYRMIALTASMAGVLLSLFAEQAFMANRSLYMGTAEKNALSYIIPLLGAGCIFLLVMLFCRLVLRRFKRISAVEALRSGSTSAKGRMTRLLKLHRSRFIPVNIFVGIQDVFVRLKTFGLLGFVFTLCFFLIIVPVNFLNTMKSPDFMTYMGAGRSDIQIDMRQTDDVAQRYNDMIAYIQHDSDVEIYAPLVTSSYMMRSDDGVYEKVSVQTGDFSLFPLAYLSGAAPATNDEIALSYLHAKERGKQLGDTLTLIVAGEERVLKLSGIYQDVTNGGKTAKALLPYEAQSVLWYMVSLDVKPGVAIGEKRAEYAAAFHPAKVTFMDDYLSQTLGSTISQLQKITALTLAAALAIAMLITALFFNMLIVKDASDIVIMRSLGFSLKHIRLQYIIRSLAVLMAGIVLGTAAAGSLGQGVVSMLMSFMGAARVEFVVNPFVAYMLIPLILLAVVLITTLFSSLTITATGKSAVAAK
ncbi:putative ABC transport system permease protein [Paenibacillus algorifonticola]|uniref:Putative ABC transport system permease protein n=1 Tax=Paenibacillus algorifonticola TaxID=684063 RepID=A0A1I2EEC3_9BACL|nr:ABC transporter permease [Paenibacillus algorifonticola]SFE91023.1 putative ABC transport system permease protein [Paenibacillus algorifonticola]